MEISTILVGRKDEKTVELREGSKWVGVGGGFEENLKRRLDTLSAKKVAKDSASDDLRVVNGNVLVRLRWSKELNVIPEQTMVRN